MRIPNIPLEFNILLIANFGLRLTAPQGFYLQNLVVVNIFIKEFAKLIIVNWRMKMNDCRFGGCTL